MSNIKSFGDLGDARSDDEDSGDFNDYYAGGEKSGQLIRGAPKDEDEHDEDAVGSLFKKAKQAGAVQGTSDDLAPSRGAFQGTGRTLTGDQAQAPSDGPTNHVITFYRNGIFTVNNGPPRRVDDPANMKFIQSISKEMSSQLLNLLPGLEHMRDDMQGECPEELEPGKAGAPVNVNLTRVEEDYKEPEKPKYSAFQGSGRTLGGTSSASTSSAAAAAAPAVQLGAPMVQWAGADEGKPTTSLQLRLADGTRQVAKFNHTHTVGDIRRFIRAARPDITYPYQLMTAFPSQPLEDESKTIEEAGLLNAVIIMKK